MSSSPVFVVQHVHVFESAREDVKMIGVYESREAAEEAVRRLAVQPGFRDWPEIIDPSEYDYESGFHIEEYRLGEDHWVEGFVTVT